MTTLSVPLSSKLEEFVKNSVKQGIAPTKAEVVRKALKKMAEEEAINDVLEAQKEGREGKILYGDLDELIKKI